MAVAWKHEEGLNHEGTVWIYNFGKSTGQKLKSIVVYVITENVDVIKAIYMEKER